MFLNRLLNSFDEFVSLNKATKGNKAAESGYTWTDAYLVTDTSPLSDGNSVGLNLVVNVEAMSFSDDFMELSGKKETFKFKDWMTGEEITETFEEGTPFDDALTGGSGNDILSGNVITHVKKIQNS